MEWPLCLQLARKGSIRNWAVGSVRKRAARVLQPGLALLPAQLLQAALQVKETARWL